MKKIISFCMILVLIFSFSIVSFADYRGQIDGIDMVSGINPVVRLKDNNQFDYVIYARDMDGMTNCDMTVHYDDSLTLINVKTTGDFDFSYYNNTDGKVYFSFMYDEKNTHDALKMYVLTFSYEKEGVYPTVEITNLAGTFIKSVADVVVTDVGDFDSDDSYDDGKPNNQRNIGDVNGDGKITAADARLALRIAASLDIVYLDVYLRADTDFDGDVSAGDARRILRVAAGLEKFNNV